MHDPATPRPLVPSQSTTAAHALRWPGLLTDLPVLFTGACRAATRGLRRAPAFSTGVLLSVALAGGLSAAVLRLYRLRSVGPPRVASALRVDAVPAADWGGSWSSALEPPAVAQTAGLATLDRILAALAVLTLAVGSLNVVLLLLGRVTARRHELAVRTALGANRGRILVQLVTEAALLGAVGSALAGLVTWAGTAVLRASWPAGLLPWDGAAGSATGGVALPLLVIGAALLAPAVALSRTGEPHAALRTGDRATPGHREMRARGALAAVQIAVALTLLSGAGMLVRNSLPMQTPSTLGYDPRDTLVARVDLAGVRFADEARRAEALETLLDRATTLPGARGASLSTPGAWLGLGTSDRVLAHCGGCYIGNMYVPARTAVVRQHVVSPGFFRTHGAAAVAGREFTRDDRQGAPPVALVNETYARNYFRDGDPLGRLVQVGGPTGDWYTIVGVVRDIRTRGIGTGSEPVPALYLSAFQHPPRSIGLAVRATGDPLALAPAVQRTLAGLGPIHVAGEPTTLGAVLVRFASPIRWFGGLYAALAGAALLLAVVGIHAAMSDQVARRRREIGTRLALGAPPRRIVTLVAARSLHLTAAGAGLGLLCALSVARLLQLLFAGVQLFDPQLFIGITLALGAAALLGAALPARRAARVDPAITLRAE